MKKFFLMLAVALPMFFFASCGDDNDEDLKDDFSIPMIVKDANDVCKFNGTVYLEWGDNNAEVKSAMNPFSYVLARDTQDTLAYTFDSNSALPFYIYAFVNNSLASASITVSIDQDDKLDFSKYFKDNGYKDISNDDEDFFTYQSKDKVCVVTYGLEDGDVMAIWMPNTRADISAVVAQHLAAAKALKN